MHNFFLHIFNSTWKEVLLLRRDRAGLMVLFLMPAALVIIITLVQENVMELTGEKSSDVLLIDHDRSIIGERLKATVLETERVRLVESEESLEQGLDRVARGDFQVCIYIPEHSSEKLKSEAAALFEGDRGADRPSASLPVYFDPGVLPGFRSGILAMLQLTVFRIEMEAKIQALEAKAAGLLPPGPPQGVAGAAGPPVELQRLSDNLLSVEEKPAGETTDQNPSAVQRNIPAWSLFGLFFTCIPLAGSLLTERRSGIWIRLRSQPVSPVSLLIGKIMGYVAVCFCQVCLIVLIGSYLFPYLGLPPFDLTGDRLSLVVITLSCGLAACGYGVFLGSVCSTMEQASMFGSISIVIAASLGGTMVPTYAMPGIMQRISVYSPLNWGLNSYLDVLLRGFDLSRVGDDIVKLLLFFAVLLLLSWQLNRRTR
jgi:ABC-2 type transport system permease protein